MCIGEPFAKLEAVLALATLARQWKLENTNNGPVAMKQGLLLNPDQAIVMRAKRRRPANTQIYVEHVTAAS